MLIKPASSLCNMRCKYCFYHDEAANRRVVSYGIMSEATAEMIIKRALDESCESVTFAFQGGEPTLAGLEYYERFCFSVNRYNKKKLKVLYAIQTNGIFTESAKWAEFFYRNDFLVGLSFDGTRYCHDLNRIDFSGNGTASKVLACAVILNKYKVKYNILTVINASTARHIEKIFAFYKKQKWRYIQFIPCLPLRDNEDQNVFALTPEAWLKYNNTLFDLWYQDVKSDLSNRVPLLSIRHLDDYLRAVAGLKTETCGTLGICSIQNVIEADGSVYPCDFMALDEYRLGNINTNSFRDLFESECAQNFIRLSCNHSEKCLRCKWYPICKGGCSRMKTNDHYIYCEVNKTFYEYTYERAKELTKLIMRG